MGRPTPTYDAARAKIESMVRERPGIQRHDLIEECMEALGCSQSIAAKAISDLRGEGEIESHGNTRNSSGYFWVGGRDQPDDRIRRVVRAMDAHRFGGVRLSPMEWSVRQLEA